jgi:uridine kinase
MSRKGFLRRLAQKLASLRPDCPLRVALDGIDAAGKSSMADELATALVEYGRPVVRASVDGFHNPSQVRYRRGEFSPQGYYYDSFNYPALVLNLLDPLRPGGSRRYRTAVFDYQTDTPIQQAVRVAAEETILLCDGIFLLRPELIHYWEVSIFLEVTFENALIRALARNQEEQYTPEALVERYRQRYQPGQQLYLDLCRPGEKADIIVDNNDLDRPFVVKRER